MYVSYNMYIYYIYFLRNIAFCKTKVSVKNLKKENVSKQEQCMEGFHILNINEQNQIRSNMNDKGFRLATVPGAGWRACPLILVAGRPATAVKTSRVLKDSGHRVQYGQTQCIASYLVQFTFLFRQQRTIFLFFMSQSTGR